MKSQAAKRNRRLDVITAAQRHGWESENHHYGTDSEILLDLFRNPRAEIRCVWIRTPWSDSGRYAGAIFSDRQDKIEWNLWKVEGKEKSALMGALLLYATNTQQI